MELTPDLITQFVSAFAMCISPKRVLILAKHATAYIPPTRPMLHTGLDPEGVYR